MKMLSTIRPIRNFPLHFLTTLVIFAPLGVPPLGAQERCNRQNVGTHELHYCVHGDGAPVVVLAAGTGQTSRSFDDLSATLANVGTIITFDRAGMGQSQPGPNPRSPVVIASELLTLLDVVVGQVPLILVGHSAGGWQMLRLAAAAPHRVAGVVLIDTPPADFEERRMSLLTPEERQARRDVLDEGAQRAPSVVQAEREAAQLGLARGFDDFPRDVPLIVIVANGQDFGAGLKNADHRRLWIEMSHAWTQLSDVTELVIADGSGHMIHHDQPTIVIDSIERLAKRIR